MPHLLKARRRSAAQRTSILISVLSLLAMVTATFVAMQAIVNEQDRQTLQQEVDSLAVQMDMLISDVVRTLDAAQHPQSQACRQPDIDQLRALTFQSLHVRDIARLQDGAVVCSGMWGVLEQPRHMPAPSYQKDGYSFWADLPVNAHAGILVDMTGRKDVLVVAPSNPFESTAGLRHAGGYVITDTTMAAPLKVFGATEGLLDAARGAGHSSAREHIAHACAERHGICIHARSRYRLVFEQSPWILAATAVTGILAGLGVGSVLNGLYRRRRSLPAQLKRAIHGRGLMLVYQPVLRLCDGGIVGFEALLRWRDEDGTDVSPELFVAMAEARGLASEMTREVIRIALTECAATLREDRTLYIALNFGIDELLDPAIRSALYAQLDVHDVDASQIAIEITERSSANVEGIAEVLEELRGRGFRIFIDDFGTGYSNLSYMAALPLDAIKMDKGFTRAIGTSAPSAAIIRSICDMAGALDVQLVVEGVETREQADFMAAMWPDALVQGWLFGRPQSWGHCMVLLKERDDALEAVL